jgi:hypothetical protein
MSRKAKEGAGRSIILDDVAHIAEQAVQFVRYTHLWERQEGSEIHLSAVNIYPPSVSRNGMWLVVGKGWRDGDRLVSFYRSPDCLTALVGFFVAARQQRLVWKVDVWKDG